MRLEDTDCGVRRPPSANTAGSNQPGLYPRDGSGAWADPYDGRVEFTVIGFCCADDAVLLDPGADRRAVRR
jgi:hypothetical protein